MEFKKRDGECDEATFWECVTEIKWPNLECGKVSRGLLFSWSPDFAKSFRDILDTKVNQLGLAFEKFESNLHDSERDYWLGDDGFSDLMNHVVGLGKETFESSLEDPEHVAERARKNDYKESFSYCIPHPPSVTSDFDAYMKMLGYPSTKEDWEYRRSYYYYPCETYEEWLEHMREDHMLSLKGDWRNIEPEHYAVATRPYLRRCELFLEALGERTKLTGAEQEAYDAIDRLSSYFRLVQQGKTDEALAASEIALKSWWLAYLIMEQGELREKHAQLMPMAGNRTYGGENLINDHRRYLGNLDGFKCREHYWELKKAS